jgi:GTP-binding protein
VAKARSKTSLRAAPEPGPAAPWAIVEASFVAAAQAASQLPPQLGVELAFAGRSNVGKSSLLNALMGRRNLVRTSSTPGCTRQINFFEARARDGAAFRLVDLPGYGYAKRSKDERAIWAQLIETYLAERDWLRAVVLLVDARRGLEPEEADLITFVQARGKKRRAEVIVVATKIDKVQKSQHAAAVARLRQSLGHTAIAVSAVTGEGIDRLWQALRRAALVAPAG